MEWARILAYITGTVDQELLLRNEYLAAEKPNPDPHQYPSGSRTAVLVNGAIVVKNSVHTGALPGKDHAGRVG